MLLESALADFSTDDSRASSAQPGTVPSEWGSVPDKSKSPPKDGSNSDAGPAQIKHVYQLDFKLPPGRKLSGEPSATHWRQTSSGHSESPRHSKQSLSSLDQSRSPPPLDDNLGPSTSSGSSLTSEADENLLHEDMSISGEEVSALCVSDVPRGTSKSALPAGRGRVTSNAGNSTLTQHTRQSGANENILHGVVSSNEESAAVPFTSNVQLVKPKMQYGRSVHQEHLQRPPARLMVTKERDASASNGLGSLGSYTRAISPAPAQKRANKKQQQGRTPIYPSKGAPTQPNRLRLGDVIQVKKPEPFNGLRRGNNDRSQFNSFRRMDSDSKYYEEESPVSTLERLPSPPTTNSSGSSGSSVRSPRTESVAVLRDTPAPTIAAMAASRRRPQSFSSSSAQSSPRASTSSSARYMGHCLVALQAALAVDPEKSKRYEDSFVELDTFIEGDESRSYADSPVNPDLERSDKGSPVWAGGARSELEPEYNTMDFYSDNGDDIDHQSNASSPVVSSLEHSTSGSSTTSVISRQIRQSSNLPRVSVDEYSVKDKRFLSDHPSSWVERGDDSITSSLRNSKCSTMTRHQDVSWDDQQADLNSERAEEVVRGAIDGLRFTYSPVSSAFVFARSNDGDEEASDSKIHSRSPQNTTDSETSRRFSISLDYATSVCSEESHSFARGSDVTELGLSRAESWSKVARGIAFQQAQQSYQDAVPSSFLRRAGYVPLFEDGTGTQSPEFKPRGFVDGNDTRIIRKPPSKKTGMATCLPFRSILRNFKTIGSPGRSRLGPSSNEVDRQLAWTSQTVHIGRQSY